ncbi:MAG: hypothetical protein SCABRO_03607 [Candidatus Scalindua brodae]|uniref:Uncharacterized protein n=1 Tax=Candidatus Scalindua brodae TaxID=237368 RepID=A0A0B0EEZ5_9BACT|nr:MAG: hypothetical protein SCABRO_03607 [Candidatus Scalindua brodae]
MMPQEFGPLPDAYTSPGLWIADILECDKQKSEYKCKYVYHWYPAKYYGEDSGYECYCCLKQINSDKFNMGFQCFFCNRRQWDLSNPLCPLCQCIVKWGSYDTAGKDKCQGRNHPQYHFTGQHKKPAYQAGRIKTKAGNIILKE